MAEKAPNIGETLTSSIEKEGFLSGISRGISNVVRRVRTAINRMYTWSKDIADTSLKELFPELHNLKNKVSATAIKTSSSGPPKSKPDDEEEKLDDEAEATAAAA